MSRYVQDQPHEDRQHRVPTRAEVEVPNRASRLSAGHHVGYLASLAHQICADGRFGGRKPRVRCRPETH